MHSFSFYRVFSYLSAQLSFISDNQVAAEESDSNCAISHLQSKLLLTKEMYPGWNCPL